MTDKTDRLNLTDGQKTRLLSLALEPDRPANTLDGDEERGDLLWDMLRRPLPEDRPLHRVIAPSTKASCHGLRSVLGPSLGDLLQDPKTDTAVLRQIKDRAKKRGEQAASKVEKDVYLVVYFAVIACALAFHDERITRHSDFDLARFFGLYTDVGWIPTELTTLFKKGIEKLSSKV